MKITKRNGKTEEFNSAKVERSVKNAGVDDKNAKDIAKQISEKNYATTNEIRTAVNNILTKHPETAKKYEGSRTLVARRALEAIRGIARLSKAGMVNLNLKEGDNVRLLNKTKNRTMEVDKNNKTDIEWNEIRLHEKDMKILGISNGEDIIAQMN